MVDDALRRSKGESVILEFLKSKEYFKFYHLIVNDKSLKSKSRSCKKVKKRKIRILEQNVSFSVIFTYRFRCFRLLFWKGDVSTLIGFKNLHIFVRISAFFN